MKRKRSSSPKHVPLLDDSGLIKMDDKFEPFESSIPDSLIVTVPVSLPVAPVSEGTIAVHDSSVTSITSLQSSIVGVTSFFNIWFLLTYS